MSRRYYSSVTWTEICAFWGMVIAAISYAAGGLISFLINTIDKIDGKTGIGASLRAASNLLTLLGHIALLIAIAIPAWHYVAGRRKGWKIFFWIMLVIYVLGVGFGAIPTLRQLLHF